ncbi:hypothetical protein GJR96_08960 [Haloferax sp. MBLA0076]|uniref:Uncharacterized protein n=1 Tax=Haloferax litoreum TaxID=2666140 RepID=A0A6A8GFB7_9EURY|nr:MULTISPECIES: hypothetical protein [Haloferax]KAB1193569.1 hypothetical protein Hfx1148_08945 [Haloferax sp. CBA1148]MRX22084.1 hypothetical protein [Haloferax litoreum]
MAQSSLSLPSILVAALVVLVALSGAFLVVDFDAATYQTSAEHTATAASAGAESLPPVNNGYLVVDAPDAIRDDLTDELVASFQREGLSLDPIEARDSYDRAVVVVVVDEWNPRWNPVTPSGSVTWRAAFDAGGHRQHIDAGLSGDPFVFNSTMGPDVAGTLDARVDVSGTGLVSRPAYRTRLIDAVSNTTAEQVTAQFEQGR